MAIRARITHHEAVARRWEDLLGGLQIREASRRTSHRSGRREDSRLANELADGGEFGPLLDAATDNGVLSTEALVLGLLGQVSELSQRLRPSEMNSRGRETSEGLLNTRAAANYLGLAVQTLAALRLSGDTPPFFKLGHRVFYESKDLEAWVNKRKRRSTSDPGSR